MYFDESMVLATYRHEGGRRGKHMTAHDPIAMWRSRMSSSNSIGARACRCRQQVVKRSDPHFRSARRLELRTRLVPRPVNACAEPAQTIMTMAVWTLDLALSQRSRVSQVLSCQSLDGAEERRGPSSSSSAAQAPRLDQRGRYTS